MEENKNSKNNLIIKNNDVIGINNQQLLNLYPLDTIIAARMANPYISSNGLDNFYEFDVELSDNQIGLYFTNTGFYIKYDTLTFFPNLQRGTGFEVTPIGFLKNNPKYNPVVYNPYNSGNGFYFGVSWRQFANYPLYELPSTPTPFVHVKMKMQDCTHSSMITMWRQGTIATAYSLDAFNDTIRRNYDDLIFTDSLFLSGCPIVRIDSIYPDSISAGTNDTLYIIGSGFGSSRGNGNVFLPDAEYGGNNHYLHLDSLDYIEWTDSTIRCILPSTVDSINNLFEHCPGSGIVKIKTNNQDSISYTKPLDIHFAVNCTFKNNSLDKLFNYLLPPYDHVSTFGAYIIRPDTSISNYPDRLSCLDKAIKQWNCLTNVNFKLGTDSIVSYPSTYNGVSSVYVADIGNDSSTFAKTTQSIYYSPLLGSNLAPEFDIVFNARLMFKCFADTNPNSSIPQNMYDFYHVILHELGHAHSLKHVNDVNAMMLFSTRTSYYGINSSERIIKLYNDQSALDGGIWTYNKSFMIDSIGTALYPMRPSTENCTGVIGFEDKENPKLNLLLYPNPTYDILYLSFNLEKSSTVTINVYNLFGVELYSVQYLGASKFEIPFSLYPSGLYFIKIQIGSKEYIAKIVKQ